MPTTLKTTKIRLHRRITRDIVWVLLMLLLAITSLRWIDPLTSSVMLQHNITALRTGGFDSKEFVHYQWVDWDNIASALALAVVASEDQRFPLHVGIDTAELQMAIKQGGHRGASTITQQVAKNMFLWQGRSYFRKAIEAALALYINFAWGKRRVLEIYLNIARVGENTYGVGAASWRFFNKPASRINRFEAARLAAVLPNPEQFSLRHSSRYIADRQHRILKQMQQLGGLSYLDAL